MQQRWKAVEEDVGVLLFGRDAAGVDQLDHAFETTGMAAQRECGRCGNEE